MSAARTRLSAPLRTAGKLCLAVAVCLSGGPVGGVVTPCCGGDAAAAAVDGPATHACCGGGEAKPAAPRGCCGADCRCGLPTGAASDDGPARGSRVCRCGSRDPVPAAPVESVRPSAERAVEPRGFRFVEIEARPAAAPVRESADPSPADPRHAQRVLGVWRT